MENQLPNFPVKAQTYVAPGLSSAKIPGVLQVSKLNLNKNWLITILVIFVLITLPVIAFVLGKQQENARQNAEFIKTMSSIKNAPPPPTETPTPIPFVVAPIVTPVATASGTTTPVATPAAVWKTYTNTKYTFSIQYPNTWYNNEYADKTGAGFASSGVPYSSASEEIKASAIAKISDSLGLSFADYVKVAGIKEFEFTKLASIKPITTTSGVTGYEITWTNQDSSESLPITYFEIPSDKTATIQIFLKKATDLDIYNKMLSTFTITQ